MFRAIPCSSSGGQIILLQHLVSSLSVSSYLVYRLSTIMHGQKNIKLRLTSDCMWCSTWIWPPLSSDRNEVTNYTEQSAH